MILKRLLRRNTFRITRSIGQFNEKEYESKALEEKAIRIFFNERKKFHDKIVEKNPLDMDHLTFAYLGIGLSVTIFLAQATSFGIFCPLAYAVPIITHAGMNIAAGVSIIDLMKEENCNKSLKANVLVGSGFVSALAISSLITLDFSPMMVVYGSLGPILINSAASFFILQNGVGYGKLAISFIVCALASAFVYGFVVYYKGEDGFEELKLREIEDYKQGILIQSTKED